MSEIVNKQEFQEILEIIKKARNNAFRAVNKELIDMYWQIGEYVSGKIKTSGWGESIVKEFSSFIQANFVGIKGFSPQNIWRMKQFYETYHSNEKLSTLLREISWSNNLEIMSRCDTDEKREFYLLLSAKNHYSFRELERQLDTMLYEKNLISNIQNRKLIKRNPNLSTLRDSYTLEFLSIEESHKEKDLRDAIVDNLKNFLLEFGKDFTFIGEEYKIQVGNTDFYIDLLFYNRALSCLVPIELKIGKFKPAHLGQIQLYLEALDRDIRNKNENPSVGLILCSEKDDTVVEYMMSRNLSPTMIAEYKLHLPDAEMLKNKLEELTNN